VVGARGRQPAGSRDLVDGSQLLRRTRRSFTLSGARTIGRGELGVDLLLAGPRADIDAVSGDAVQDGGYLLAGVHGKLNLTPSVVRERPTRQRTQPAL